MATKSRARPGLLLAVAVGGAYGALFRLGCAWGATRYERRQPLPGDHLVHDSKLITTHAITIETPPDAVWPWLVQMGWGRGGWYTYRWVDRLLFPANSPSTDHIVAQWQHLKVGDRVPDGPPQTECAFTVDMIEENRLLVLRSGTHLPLSWRRRAGVGIDWVWSWHLIEPEGGRTRVVQRSRMRLHPWWLELGFLATIVPADFVMARSHLRALKQLAERRHPAVGAGTT